MKFTYLLIDLLSVLVPFIFSFHPALKFYRSWPALIPSTIITGVVFISWDMYFTHLKVWGFSPAYCTGIYIGNLPVEEILFFLCIPYACVFTYACLNLLARKNLSTKVQLLVSSFLIAASVLMVLRFYNLYYTAFSFSALAILVFTAQFIFRANWLSRFYLTYLLLLLPFLIVNGLLTGTGLDGPVVWYDPVHILGLRILTIPFEDIFYGMDMLLLNIMIYTGLRNKLFEKLKRRRKTANRTGQLTYLT